MGDTKRFLTLVSSFFIEREARTSRYELLVLVASVAHVVITVKISYIMLIEFAFVRIDSARCLLSLCNSSDR
jgi:hypothetical protein